MPHDLPRPTARRAARAAVASYQTSLADYSPTTHWRDDDHGEVRFTGGGRAFVGRFTVLDDAIELELDVPLWLRPFAGVAIGIIEREMAAWLARARRGEFDDEG
jgi:hypothetical protein